MSDDESLGKRNFVNSLTSADDLITLDRSTKFLSNDLRARKSRVYDN